MKLTFLPVPSLSLHIKYISKSLHLMSSVCLEPTSLLFCLQATTIITLPTPITVSSMLSWPSILFSHSTHRPLCLCDTSFIHLFLYSFIYSLNKYLSGAYSGQNTVPATSDRGVRSDKVPASRELTPDGHRQV